MARSSLKKPPARPVPQYVNGVVFTLAMRTGDADAPDWSTIGPRVAALLADRLMIAHHAEFDRRMIWQTSMRHGMTRPELRIGCTMELLSEREGRWVSLVDAAAMFGVAAPATRHRARADAEQCRQIALAATRAAPVSTQA